MRSDRHSENPHCEDAEASCVEQLSDLATRNQMAHNNMFERLREAREAHSRQNAPVAN